VGVVRFCGLMLPASRGAHLAFPEVPAVRLDSLGHALSSNLRVLTFGLAALVATLLWLGLRRTAQSNTWRLVTALTVALRLSWESRIRQHRERGLGYSAVYVYGRQGRAEQSAARSDGGLPRMAPRS